MDYRQYDPAIGRFNVVDPLAEKKYDNTPYRFGFNNPIYFIDPTGLFETRKEAREYRREHRDEGVSGGITKNDDGSFSINDKENHISYFKAEKGLEGSNTNSDGITTSPLVTSSNSSTSDSDLSKTNSNIGAFGLGIGVASAGISLYRAGDYYQNGGTGADVGIKASLDATMSLVGTFGGPVGFGISATYFIADYATGGFGGYGAINP